jgi:acyl carrier protein
MTSTTFAMRGLLFSVVLVGLTVVACQRVHGPRTVVIDPTDDAALERLLREIIAEERKVDPNTIDMKRPFNQPPLNADASAVGTIAIRIQQRLDFFFTDDEFKQWSKGKAGRGPQQESPEWLLKFTKQAPTRQRVGQ